jgi:hypothetical protein
MDGSKDAPATLARPARTRRKFPAPKAARSITNHPPERSFIMNLKPCLFALVLFAFPSSAVWAETPQPSAAQLAHPQQDKAAPPDSGRLTRQIETQHILENLNDQITETARLEPDLPYTVQEGGIRLPANQEN